MFSDRKMISEITNMLPNWLDAITNGSTLDLYGVNVELNEMVAPKTLLESVEMSTARAILVQTVTSTCDADRQFSLLWFEKIRRYCEINRPILKQVSLRRFGKDSVQQNLELITLILSVGSYHTKNILLFNALGTLVDFLSGSPFSKEWHERSIKKIADAVLSKPELYLGVVDE